MVSGIGDGDGGVGRIGIRGFRLEGGGGKVFVFIDTVDAGVKSEGFPIVVQAVSQAAFSLSFAGSLIMLQR